MARYNTPSLRLTGEAMHKPRYSNPFGALPLNLLYAAGKQSGFRSVAIGIPPENETDEAGRPDPEELASRKAALSFLE